MKKFLKTLTLSLVASLIALSAFAACKKKDPTEGELTLRTAFDNTVASLTGIEITETGTSGVTITKLLVSGDTVTAVSEVKTYSGDEAGKIEAHYWSDGVYYTARTYNAAQKEQGNVDSATKHALTEDKSTQNQLKYTKEEFSDIVTYGTITKDGDNFISVIDDGTATFKTADKKITEIKFEGSTETYKLYTNANPFTVTPTKPAGFTGDWTTDGWTISYSLKNASGAEVVQKVYGYTYFSTSSAAYYPDYAFNEIYEGVYTDAAYTTPAADESITADKTVYVKTTFITASNFANAYALLKQFDDQKNDVNVEVSCKVNGVVVLANAIYADRVEYYEYEDDTHVRWSTDYNSDVRPSRTYEIDGDDKIIYEYGNSAFSSVEDMFSDFANEIRNNPSSITKSGNVYTVDGMQITVENGKVTKINAGGSEFVIKYNVTPATSQIPARPTTGTWLTEYYIYIRTVSAIGTDYAAGERITSISAIRFVEDDLNLRVGYYGTVVGYYYDSAKTKPITFTEGKAAIDATKLTKVDGRYSIYVQITVAE